LAAARHGHQQQTVEHQSALDDLHRQLSDVTSQLGVSATSVDRLTTSLSRERDRAEELQARLEQTDALLKNKV